MITNSQFNPYSVTLLVFCNSSCWYSAAVQMSAVFDSHHSILQCDKKYFMPLTFDEFGDLINLWKLCSILSTNLKPAATVQMALKPASLF